jgi:NAD(P)-dependent dehydrogenase (short-subunit alcohol dehydrogenase family)
MSRDLSGKVAIITGSGRGIGRALALGFAGAGARVIVSGRVSDPHARPHSIEAVSNEITAAGGHALAIRCDVTSEADVGELVGRTLEYWGRIDILVNNAAVLWRTGLLETSAAKWNEIVRTNLDGVYYCTMAVLPSMMGQRWGSIVNISSGHAYSDNDRATAYAATKSALNRLTIKLAAELRPHNVAVNALDPGGTLTERILEQVPKEQRADWLPPEQKKIVPACLFLAGQNDLTGNVLREADFGITWPG